MGKFKVGDKVMIIEKDTHYYRLKEHYGKEHIIEEMIKTKRGTILYKVVGVENWALESDLRKV